LQRALRGTGFLQALIRKAEFNSLGSRGQTWLIFECEKPFFDLPARRAAFDLAQRRFSAHYFF
jgi:hypothetical protein